MNALTDKVRSAKHAHSDIIMHSIPWPYYSTTVSSSIATATYVGMVALLNNAAMVWSAYHCVHAWHFLLELCTLSASAFTEPSLIQ